MTIPTGYWPLALSLWLTFQQRRLLEGGSTANLNILMRPIDQSHDTLFEKLKSLSPASGNDLGEERSAPASASGPMPQ